MQDDSRCASDEDWNMVKKGEIDLKKIEFDNAVDDDEIDYLDDEDVIHLNDGLADDNSNNIEHIWVINQHDEQQNYFDVHNNNLQPQNNHFEWLEEHDSDANDNDKNINNHIHISDDDGSNTDYNSNGKDLNDSQQHDSDL